MDRPKETYSSLSDYLPVVDAMRKIIYSILLVFSFLLVVLVFFITDSQPNNKSPESIAVPQIKRTEGQARGEEIYMDRCSGCHKPIHTAGFEGPRMDGLFERIPYEGFFQMFIQNSDSLKKSGDGYAKAVDHDNNVDYEHSFKDLSNQDISDLKEYIKTP